MSERRDEPVAPLREGDADGEDTRGTPPQRSEQLPEEAPGEVADEETTQDDG